MKRLLAYLFIVLGLGLTFSVNVNAETKPSYADKYKYCLKKDFKGSIYDLNSIGQTDPCSSEEYELDWTTYDKMTKSQHRIGKSKKLRKNFYKNNYESTKRILEEYLKKNPKIAKAEPNQSDKYIPIKFCAGGAAGHMTMPYFYSPSNYCSKLSYHQWIKTKKGWASDPGPVQLCYRPWNKKVLTNQDKEHVTHVLLDQNCGERFYKVKYFKTDNGIDYFVKGSTQLAKIEPSQTQPDSDLEEEKNKIAEEKRKIAEAKKKKEEEEQKRIAEAKKKEEEEQKYRILVKKYGDDCKDNSLGSPEFNKCLKEVEAEDLLQAKLQREFLASLTPEEARAYTCNNTFGFRKGSSNFKDCIFKLYTTELELEKLDLEKQLALAKVEAEKAKADTARAQVEIIQARSAAARAEGKLQEAQIQATKAQTLSMQQQAAASRQQAAAAQAQARAAQQQNSLNLMTQGLKMLSGNQSSTRLRTNCSWSSIGISCR